MGRFISYADEIEQKIQFYKKNKNRKFEFEENILPLIAKFEVAKKPDKILILLEFFEHLDNYSDILFSPYSQYTSLVKTLKRKLVELGQEKELSRQCQYLLDKYYDEYCRAFTLKHRRCRNKISFDKSDHFCGAHYQKYVPKVMRLVMNELSQDTAGMCVSCVF
jgi:hypothetical protein